MSRQRRDELVAIIDASRPGPRDKGLLALRALAEAGRLSEAMCQFHVQRLLLSPPRHTGGLRQAPTLAEWRSGVKVEAPVGTLVAVDGAEFGACLSDRVEHWGFCGCSGAGKTVGLRSLGINVAQSRAGPHGRPVVLLVIEIKRDYADFVERLGLPCVRFRNVDNLAWWGVQAPAGVPPVDWATELSLILAARCGLKHATTSIARMLTWLVQRLNPDPQVAQLWPDPQLLCDVAVAAPPEVFAAKDTYERSAIQVLDGIAHTLGAFARTFRGLDLEEQFARGISVVLDLSTLAPPAQWVVIDVLLSQLLVGRLARDQKCDRTEVLVLLDESDELVTDHAHSAFPNGQSPLLRILRRGREYGVMAALGINDLAGTSEALLNNVQNLVVLKQNAPACITAATRALILDRDAVTLLRTLKQGEAILRLASWDEPVLAQVTFVPPHRGSTATPAPDIPVVPAQRLAELPAVAEALRQAPAPLRRAKWDATETPEKLLAYVHDVIADWVRKPGKPLARIWETLKIDQPARQKAIRKAMAPAFAELRDERFGSIKSAILRPNDRGYALVGRRPPEGQGCGEMVHQHGVYWARDWALQQGYEARLEWRVPGTRHPADLGYWVDGKWHVIEVVVTSFDNLADAVRASLLVSDVVASVTIVTRLKKEHERVRRILSAADLAAVVRRVQLSTFDFYLRAVHP